MKESNVKKLVFSSSASVYGAPEYTVDETHPLSPTNTYARTKQHVEQMMSDVAHSDKDWRFIFLRYFNPVGAHQSGLIGESPSGTPTNLMPYVSRGCNRRVTICSSFWWRLWYRRWHWSEEAVSMLQTLRLDTWPHWIIYLSRQRASPLLTWERDEDLVFWS